MDQMGERKDVFERRRHERFRVEDGAWVVVRPFFHKNPRGQIVDISRSGLAFCYTVEEESLDDSLELDICFADYGFCLRRAPFKIISDLKIDNGNPPEAKPINRRGVEFGELTLKQISQLNYFNENHTRGRVQVI